MTSRHTTQATDRLDLGRTGPAGGATDRGPAGGLPGAGSPVPTIGGERAVESGGGPGHSAGAGHPAMDQTATGWRASTFEQAAGTGDLADPLAAAAALRLAVAAGALDLPLPGAGSTLERFAGLAALARADLALAKLGEAHADAIAILAELGGPEPGPDSIWGVWAAAPNALTAHRDGPGWLVDGDKPWCSGAGVCTDALITAAATDGPRLFAVRLPGDRGLPDSWPAYGMAGSDSRTVRFTAQRAVPVGGPGGYTDRPGFWHGAVGVAACWYGGAAGVAEALYAAAARRSDPHLAAHLGAVDTALWQAKLVLRHAAQVIDTEPRGDCHALALRCRAAVEAHATEVLTRTGRALGAGPLGGDRAHSRRVADLPVYLRQSHAERDLAELGALVHTPAPDTFFRDPLW